MGQNDEHYHYEPGTLVGYSTLLGKELQLLSYPLPLYTDSWNGLTAGEIGWMMFQGLPMKNCRVFVSRLRVYHFCMAHRG